ncbi:MULTISPECIES: DUF6227 family protein [unclassified Streptomyces]|uniref:DUF6227 family protein n=1 Tax=unclassified Streptomyces TaxID=2593676 RepID=UPI0019065836|nr:DUF6227 family protein [Streptomyces sp. HSG2]
MSVRYHAAGDEPPESPLAPAEHLRALLRRALNSFEAPAGLSSRLDRAPAYDRSLRSAHHSAGQHRETYRHTWLLADCSTVTLWELVHTEAGTDRRHHEVYADEEELRAATIRLPLPPEAPGPADFDPPSPAAPPPPPPRHSYVRRGTADHARRLLRRAENPDQPGPDVAARLADACAHRITQALGRPRRTGRSGPSCVLYEHAFLLGDGGETSLWEVEHTATPDGRHMCEVYASEDGARKAMARRAAQVP